MGHTALQLRNQDQTRGCSTPKTSFSPSFADADAEGGGSTSLAKNNLDPKPAVMGGPGYPSPHSAPPRPPTRELPRLSRLQPLRGERCYQLASSDAVSCRREKSGKK